jgi:carbon-monoxide dehydrogenase large subunit
MLQDEDGGDAFRKLTGAASFVDDLRSPDAAFAVFVRSPHPHARILDVDCAPALAASGALAVLTGADLAAAGIGNVSTPAPLAGRDGAALIVPHRPSLAHDRVLHVGQPVALVVAASIREAEDAAEKVGVDYEALPAVTDAALALGETAPQLWPEALGNLAIDWRSAPDGGEIDAILATAARRVRLTLLNQRVAGVPLEPRGATALFDEADGRYTLHVGSQGAGPLRAQIAAAMKVDPGKLRVITGDVGGSFGLKTPGYPEYPALLFAARRLGRPVRWNASRSESFVSDNQGRDNFATAELAMNQAGKFLALKVDAITNMGAFLSANGAHIATGNFARCFPGVYDIPHIAVRVRCVFTNTVPTGPYRGAGRPEANYVLERLVDVAARETGLDRVRLRRLNLLPPDAMPHRTAVGTVIDSGEFEAILGKALQAADHESFERRRAEAAGRGKLRGIGIACFLEHAGAMGFETVEIRFAAGGLALEIGVQSTGQAHGTIFPRLLADRLGIDRGRIALRQGDSDVGLKGGPSVASRSTMTVGAALLKAVESVIAKGRGFAAEALEADEADVIYEAGNFRVTGTDRVIPLPALAERVGNGLDSRETAEVPQSFPNGCHVAEVEIDPETGQVEVASYVAVDDCGTVLDHALVEGQVLGGLAQGLGQALLEAVIHDSETGQILTGTLNDYAMPRAADMPPVTALEHPVFCRTSPLGVKGVGEAGTTGAIGAIMNAIADAIPNVEAAALQMPATPEKIWRLCRAARHRAQ